MLPGRARRCPAPRSGRPRLGSRKPSGPSSPPRATACRRAEAAVRARAGTVLVAALLLAGCTSFTESADPSGSRSSPSGGGLATAAPTDPLTVVAGSDPAGSAVGASRALFTHAELAVVARDDDPAGALLGASAAVGLGAPLLLTPAGGSLADDPLGAELDRLGTRTVLSVGADP